MDELRNFAIHALDGDLGQVQDFLFDQPHWKARYLVVDTGTWLPGRKVLIAPEAIGQPDLQKKHLAVNLTRQQIKDSPSVDTEVPLNEKDEFDVRNYYGWPLYWGYYPGQGPYNPVRGVVNPPAFVQPPQGSETPDMPPYEQADPDHRLHRLTDVQGFDLFSRAERLGTIEDMLLDPETWEIKHLVAKVGALFQKKEILIPSTLVESFGWHAATIQVRLQESDLENYPEFHEDEPLMDQEHMARLYIQGLQHAPSHP
jgi:sporulation protein YlmC with PRC-barrel domain